MRIHPPISNAADQHLMVPFTSYQELHSFIFTKSCNSTEVRNLYNPTPAPVIQNTNTNGLNPGGFTVTVSTIATSGTSTVTISTSATPSHSETNTQMAALHELD